MRIVVCLRQGLDGDINPFDACAYEEALRIDDAEVILLSMGAIGARDLLQNLTRLGAKRAILLNDKSFAGADTLATAYTLSLAIKKLSADLVFCGRQTLVGDTAQTGAMLSVYAGLSLITNVMSIDSYDNERISCTTRSEGAASVALPALLTIERINTLRLPRIRSRAGEVEVWGAHDIGADESRIGLIGSPTRVIKTFENTSGKRKCQFISQSRLKWAITEGLKKNAERISTDLSSDQKLPLICTVGEAPIPFAKTVADKVTVIPLSDADSIAKRIKEIDPPAVLWGSDTESKRLSAVIAAMLGLGLCADCTALECEGGELMMYRPAMSGSIIAKIRSITHPAMATVRTESDTSRDVIIAAGFGVKDSLDDVKRLADEVGAELCATRRLVDNGYARYDMQVGLTGKTVAPSVYLAIGVSGAVHHIVGMQRSGVVIAIDSDKNAPIFDYADFGIVEEFDLSKIN